jgi:hypothetical protein
LSHVAGSTVAGGVAVLEPLSDGEDGADADDDADDDEDDESEGVVKLDAEEDFGADAEVLELLLTGVTTSWSFLSPPDYAIAATIPPASTTAAPTPMPTLRPVLFFFGGIGLG